ncbi:MAG: IclR family transcriptional regulator [Lachnospiraceae bacterium]|jgi:IclR family KDG regulon transcriptional repressor|nr:IclR family transcriptional regulator [Lachnospiraceae bacterium]MCI8994764.1 IclR family transcriptional regulator [Lachnospiraceae bacterium]MCI9133687.1 IclR family transcriptional regulator [Lachnospiraceae bacterium]
MAETNLVKTLVKSLKVLECFANGGRELGNSEVAKLLGMNKSNSHDILQTFVRMGYMEQDPTTLKYSLSVKMLEFSSSVNQHIGYYRVVYDIMDQLADTVESVVYFSIPHDTDVLYLYSSHPKAQRKSFPYRPVGGELCPMYCSSMGKAMLAFAGTELMEKMKGRELIKFTDITIDSYEGLEREIQGIRDKGYAVDRGEHEYGIGAVGVPVFDPRRNLIAAMSICVTVSALTKENVFIFSEKLKEAAFQIRMRL